MASIAIMIAGAAFNAAAFIGGNYLACTLSGNGKAVQEEKVWHHKAIEAYQAAYAKYQPNIKPASSRNKQVAFCWHRHDCSRLRNFLFSSLNFFHSGYIMDAKLERHRCNQKISRRRESP